VYFKQQKCDSVYEEKKNDYLTGLGGLACPTYLALNLL